MHCRIVRRRAGGINDGRRSTYHKSVSESHLSHAYDAAYSERISSMSTSCSFAFPLPLPVSSSVFAEALSAFPRFLKYDIGCNKSIETRISLSSAMFFCFLNSYSLILLDDSGIASMPTSEPPDEASSSSLTTSFSVSLSLPWSAWPLSSGFFSSLIRLRRAQSSAARVRVSISFTVETQ